jgi:hypothetical protein
MRPIVIEPAIVRSFLTGSRTLLSAGIVEQIHEIRLILFVGSTKDETNDLATSETDGFRSVRPSVSFLTPAH